MTSTRRPRPAGATTACLIALAAIMYATPTQALDAATQIQLGENEYIANCASCHGLHGKGDGPVAEVLSTKPNDLTQITANYSGTFPADHIYKVISGEQMLNPHGSREMPVWGPRYWELTVDRAARVPHDVDMQAMVHGRITALVQYLESIQAD